MFFKRLIVAMALTLLLGHAYASMPLSYYKIPTLMESNEYDMRVKKYLNNSKMAGKGYFDADNFDGKIKSVGYEFFKHHLEQENIISIPDEMTETEKQSILAVFNVVTDNEQQSQKIFDEFYDNHLNKYYQIKESCNQSYCDFYIFTTVGDIKIYSDGYYNNIRKSGNNEYLPYLYRIGIHRAYNE